MSKKLKAALVDAVNNDAPFEYNSDTPGDWVIAADLMVQVREDGLYLYGTKIKIGELSDLSVSTTGKMERFKEYWSIEEEPLNESPLRNRA